MKRCLQRKRDTGEGSLLVEKLFLIKALEHFKLSLLQYRECGILGFVEKD